MRRFLLDTVKFSFLLLAIFVAVGTLFYSRAEMLNRSAVSWTGLGLEIAAIAFAFGASCAGMLWVYDQLMKHSDSN
jgi:NADH:ubiquinone oxidoreductase subunit 6 (subunit J)